MLPNQTPVVQDNNPQATQDSNQETFDRNPNIFNSSPVNSNSNQVAGTSDNFRSGISDLEKQIMDGYSKNLSMLSDTSGLNAANDKSNELIENERSNLKTQEQNDETNINANSGGQVENANAQYRQNSNQTGMYLARIGGALGNGTAGQGALENLNQTHIKQVNTLENARVSAINSAKQAYNSKDFELAKEEMTNASNLEKQINDAHKQYSTTSLDYLKQVQSINTEQAKTEAQTLKDTQTARNFAIKNGINQPFYSLDGTTLIDANTGKAVKDMDEYHSLGGKGDGSDIQYISSQPTKFETKNIIGNDGNTHTYHIGYNAQGQEVTREDLGTTKKGKATASGPSNNSKYTPQQVKDQHNMIDQAFNGNNPDGSPIKGQNGKVSPDNFNKAADYFVNKGYGTYKDFYSKHSGFADPKDVKKGLIKGAK